MAHDVFISYSSKDKPIADAVCHALESDQISCWYAPRDIRGGMSWDVAIMRAITESRVMVYVWTSNSRMSKDVTREVKHAFREEVVLIPFRLEEIQPSEELKYYLADVQYLDALPPPFEDHLQRLVNHVQANLPGDMSEKQQRGAEEQARKQTEAEFARERDEQEAQPATEVEAGKIAAEKAELLKATGEAQLLTQHQAKTRAEEEARHREAEDAARLRTENEKLSRAIEELERHRVAEKEARKHGYEDDSARAAEDAKEMAEEDTRLGKMVRLFGLPAKLPLTFADAEERQAHNDAQRFAGLLVSEIKLYNESKLTEGRSKNEVYGYLKEYIDRSREMYDKRVKPQVAERYDYFHAELLRVLAEGDIFKFGPEYPGEILGAESAQTNSRTWSTPERPLVSGSIIGLNGCLAGLLFLAAFGAWQYFHFDLRLAGLFLLSDSRIGRGFFSFIGFVLAILLARFVHKVLKK